MIVWTDLSMQRPTVGRITQIMEKADIKYVITEDRLRDKFQALKATLTTHFGRPVLPDVNIKYTGFDMSVLASSNQLLGDCFYPIHAISKLGL
jgi:hypothetical protein